MRAEVLRLIFVGLLGLTNVVLIFADSGSTNLRDIFSVGNEYRVCPSNTFQDSNSALCSNCPLGTIPDPSNVDNVGNIVGCKCPNGFAKVIVDCSVQANAGNCLGFTCTSCLLLGMAANTDQTKCVSCDSATTNGISGTDCSCKTSGYALVDTDVVGTKLDVKSCVACPVGSAVITSSVSLAGVKYYPNATKCQRCPDPLMSLTVTSGSYSCTCPSGYSLVGEASIGPQTCIRTTEAKAYIDTLDVSSQVVGLGSTRKSYTISHYFVQAAADCANHIPPANNKPCQLLANLCALQLFDASRASACKTFFSLMQGRGTQRGVKNWAFQMPWLTYDTSASPCFERFFNQRILLGIQLQYMLSIYALNGTWLGYEPLGTHLTYCGRKAPLSSLGGGTNANTKWQFFGSNIAANYSCDLNTLMDREQLFYELFVLNPTDHSLSPVPVRVVGATNPDGDVVNEVRPKWFCDSNDFLVRRFFLYDFASGVTESTGQRSYVRYASLVSVEDSLLVTPTSKVYAPVMTIQYTDINPNGWGSGIVNYRVEGRYTMLMDAFKNNVKTVFIVAMVLFGLLLYLRYSNWQRRNTRPLAVIDPMQQSVFNTAFLIRMGMLAMHSWVLVFFPFLLLTSWFFFMFYKIQTFPSFMLPPQDDIYSPTSPYYLFVVALHILGCFQLAYVLDLVIKQSYADLFLLDWEPAKAKADGSGGRVSVWRSVLVANEWSEMQTMRKTDVRITLFIIGFLYYGMNLRYDATSQPDLADKTSGTVNVLLRFATGAFWWILLTMAQYFWKYLIYQRFITEPPEQIFVDLCTIAKVSVIVLDEDYHGYYLHCRSPHQFSDGTMAELVDMLHKEESGLTVDRSLEGGPKDVQTFEIHMSGEWRTAFNKMFSVLKSPPSVSDVIRQGRRGAAAQGMAGRAGGGQDPEVASMLPRSRNSVPAERVLRAWKEVTVFLQQFIENNFGRAGLRRVIREPTYMELMFLIPPADVTAPEQPCVFLTDRNMNFTKVLFLGIESDLVLQNLLSFSLFDLWFGSTALSILLCYLIDFALCYLRENIGKTVISRKTLIDERFLV